MQCKLRTWLQSRCLLLTGILLFAGCSDPAQSDESNQVESSGEVEPVDPVESSFSFEPVKELPQKAEAKSVRSPKFQNVATLIGIEHTFDNGSSPAALMVESTGGGSGWIDIDKDGRMDLYLTQGGLPNADPPMSRPADQIFRQLSAEQFVPIRDECLIDERGYGHGVAVGDFNNDGFDDLFVCNARKNSLYLNLGDGTFELSNDVLVGGSDVWSSSAAWGDVDLDGDLDLYVCNYAIYDPYNPVECLDKEGIPSICHPKNVDPEPDHFFLNDGQGHLVESAEKFQLFGPGNKALGVVVADLTDDGWPDIYVANDTTANFLFVNQQGTHFKESAYLLGGAFSATGATQASMGLAFGDYDNNLLPDLCLTHFTGEANTLYQNLGPQGFQDVSAMQGLRSPTLSKLGFGTVMVDFNSDASMDLFFSNGHIDPRYNGGKDYQMTPQVFSYDGVKWVEGSKEAGPYFDIAQVGRSVSIADYDRDGDLDLCVVHHNTKVAILRNESDSENFLQCRLVPTVSNRSGYGTSVTVSFNNEKQRQELAGGTSFAAAHEHLLHFGLGSWNGSCNVEVRWPSGVTSAVELDEVNQQLVVVEGQFSYREQ